MRDVNRLERAIVLLALYTWQLVDAVRDYVATVRENERGLRRGAADEDWQHTLQALAAPIRRQRLATCEQTLVEWRPDSDTLLMVEAAMPALPEPSLAVDELPVVLGTGEVTQSHIRNHRVAHPVAAKSPRRVSQAAKRKALTVTAVRTAERRMRKQLDAVVLEAMKALGLTLEEARAIMGAHHYESVLDRVAVMV
jgi:hypothetical protein